ncbi:unnamed protein product [Adineta steineri]|uniref:Uncharacterized protein n=1 Tax=Adineta steineri TaxID=433720 RepID=A0A819HVN3_9BILA|nr:unnamed protein product [Adineta steineri]CAF1458012.1 unnamed protein product [Adineta steineri]CAF1573744.1 unnamed protein product [Adineta steineri]CAF1578223.1 unnamed protein product [Adineta steineri]CAF1670249.1 unnamed protein product [Adineta steineri]
MAQAASIKNVKGNDTSCPPGCCDGAGGCGAAIGDLCSRGRTFGVCVVPCPPRCCSSPCAAAGFVIRYASCAVGNCVGGRYVDAAARDRNNAFSVIFVIAFIIAVAVGAAIRIAVCPDK